MRAALKGTQVRFSPPRALRTQRLVYMVRTVLSRRSRFALVRALTGFVLLLCACVHRT